MHDLVNGQDVDALLDLDADAVSYTASSDVRPDGVIDDLCRIVSSGANVNYATWDNPFTMFEIMGFGKRDTSDSLLLSPGSTALAWGPVVHLVADSIAAHRRGARDSAARQ